MRRDGEEERNQRERKERERGRKGRLVGRETALGLVEVPGKVYRKETKEQDGKEGEGAT